MSKISGAEINAMRRMIASERTSEGAKQSYGKILQKYNVPLIEPPKTESEEKRKIKEQITKMQNVMKFSEDKEKIQKIISSLETALKYA